MRGGVKKRKNSKKRVGLRIFDRLAAARVCDWPDHFLLHFLLMAKGGFLS